MATGPNRYRGSMPQYTEQARPSATISPQVPAFVPSRMNLPAGSPAAFGTVVAKEREKFGEALSGLGKVLTDHAIKLQQQKDDNAVIQAENDLRKQMNEVMFNPDTGLAMQKGHNAENTTIAYDRTADELFDKIMEERMKSDDMRAKFAQRVSPWMNSYRAQVARNEGDEVHAAQLADIEVRHADRRDYAMRTPGAMAFTTLRAGAKQDILDRAKLTGQSAAVEEEYFQKQDSQTFVQMAGVLSKNGDVSGLTALYDAAHNDVTGEAEAQVMPLIGKVKIENDALSWFEANKGRFMNPDGTINGAEFEKWAIEDAHSTRVERRFVGGPSYADGASLVAAVNGGSWTSEYGGRVHPISGEYKFHAGTDVGADYGEDIICPENGTVIFAGEKGGYGNAAIVQFPDGTQLLVGHCQDLSVSEGQTITKGALLGHVGSTGNSTGPHVHVEFRDENDNPISPDDAASRIRASRSGGGGADMSGLPMGNVAQMVHEELARQGYNLPVEVIWAQMMHETGGAPPNYDLAHIDHNYAGIKVNNYETQKVAGPASDGGDYRHFDDDREYGGYQARNLIAYEDVGLFQAAALGDLDSVVDGVARALAAGGYYTNSNGTGPATEADIQNYSNGMKSWLSQYGITQLGGGSGSGHWEEVTVSNYNPQALEARIKLIRERTELSVAVHNTNVQNAIKTLLDTDRVKNATSYAELTSIVSSYGYSGQDLITIVNGISAPMGFTRKDIQHEREEKKYRRGEANYAAQQAIENFYAYEIDHPNATPTEIMGSKEFDALKPSQKFAYMESVGAAGTSVDKKYAWAKDPDCMAAFNDVCSAMKLDGLQKTNVREKLNIEAKRRQAAEDAPLTLADVRSFVQEQAAMETTKAVGEIQRANVRAGITKTDYGYYDEKGNNVVWDEDIQEWVVENAD